MQSRELAALVERGWNAIRSGTVWLTAAQLVARFPETFASVDVIPELTDREIVFAIELDDRQVYALYQFDDDGTPLPVMRPLLAQWRGRSRLALASWLESTTGLLSGGKRTGNTH